MIEILEIKLKGILIRSKAEYIEGAEKNTKYFANLEKKRAESKIIKTLEMGLWQKSDEILYYTKKYYSELYSCDQTIIDENEFFYIAHTTLNDNENEVLSGHISETEWEEAIKNIKN